MLLDTVANTIVGNSAEELWNGSYDEVILLTRFSLNSIR